MERKYKNRGIKGRAIQVYEDFKNSGRKKMYRRDYLTRTIDYWKVIMTTTEGDEIELI